MTAAIGLALNQAIPWPRLRDALADVEARGFDQVWFADHLMSFPRMGTLLEAWTTLAAAAVSTSRIRLGVGVTNIGYRNPAVVARQAVTVDHLSGGRLEVGIGAAGTRSEDPVVAGVPDFEPKERALRFDEFVGCVDVLLRGEGSFAGTYYRSSGFEVGGYLVQQPRPPLTLAAHGPSTMRTAAVYADRWSVLVGTNWKVGGLRDEIVRLSARFDDALADAGRSADEVIRSGYVGNVGEPHFASAEAVLDLMGTYAEVGIDEFVFPHPIGVPRLDEAGRGRMLDALTAAKARS